MLSRNYLPDISQFYSFLKFTLVLTICLNSLQHVNSKDCKQMDSLVKSLPLFSANLQDFPCLYSGFIEIDKTNNSKIFYILLTKTQWTEKDDSPLTIWLNGGPGATSLIGLFSEMGPLSFSGESNIILKENFSWNKLSHVLLVDQPVGTGYSFTNNINAIPKDQAGVSVQFYLYLQKFLTKYDFLNLSPIYLMGENYAGKYIPDITDKILSENDKIEKGESSFTHKINFKKILIGNGLFDSKYQRSAAKDLAKGINLLSEYEDESQYDYLSQKCEFSLANNKADAFKSCDDVLDYLLSISGDVYRYDVRKPGNEEGIFSYMEKYLNRDDTAKSLNVDTTSIKPPGKYFSFYNETVKEHMKEDTHFYSSIPKLEKILNNYNIPVYVFAGQFDLVDGPQGIERALHSMNFSFKEEFLNSPRLLWKIPVENKNVIAGYIKQAKNLTFITMRNAGHYAQLGRPGSLYDLVQHVLSQETSWVCPDGKCSLAPTKCSYMNNCNGNGECSDSTAGKCKCKSGFYGPDCSLEVENLETGNYKILPRYLKLLHFDNFENDILLEVDSNDKNLVISLIDRNDHEYVYDIKKHQVAYRMMNQKLILYLEKDKFANSIIVVSNLEFLHEIEIKTFIDHYSNLLFI